MQTHLPHFQKWTSAETKKEKKLKPWKEGQTLANVVPLNNETLTEMTPTIIAELTLIFYQQEIMLARSKVKKVCSV